MSLTFRRGLGRRLTAALAALAALAIASPAVAQEGAQSSGPPPELLPPHTFIDKRGNPTHGGAGQHPTTETNKFRLLGGFRWFDGDDIPPGLPEDTYDETIEYTLTPSGAAVPAGAFQTAIASGIETVDAYVDTRNFARNDASPTTNPCGGVNRVEWTPIDGAGGTLAQAFVCPARATRGMKLIVGFVIQFDSADAWSTNPGPSDDDVETVATHEFGHAAGLDHVSSWRDGCLTMYQFVAPGTTYKRALGWGDKVGLSRLYQVPDTTPRGSCSG